MSDFHTNPNQYCTQSNSEWAGSKSSKFNGGRFHFNHPADQLDHLLVSSILPKHQNGRRHFQQKETIGTDALPRPGLKIYEQKYAKSTMFNIQNIKKLIKINANDQSVHPSQSLYSSNLKQSKLDDKTKSQIGSNKIGTSKMKALQLGEKKIGIYRNFYKSQAKSMNALSNNL